MPLLFSYAQSRFFQAGTSVVHIGTNFIKVINFLCGCMCRILGSDKVAE